MVARAFGVAVVILFASGCVTPSYGDPTYAAYPAPPRYPTYPAYAGAYGAPGYPPPSYAWPAASGAAAAAVAFAQAQLGRPYCWGGSGPSCFDCSGLTRAAWMAGGLVLPRTSEAQLSAGIPIVGAALQPGDILWRPGHVGLYVGQGLVIAATHTGDFVRYQRADGFVRAIRPWR